MDLWNAQSLFMRFFPLISPDDKPKGISVSILLFLKKGSQDQCELGFYSTVKIVTNV